MRVNKKFTIPLLVSLMLLLVACGSPATITAPTALPAIDATQPPAVEPTLAPPTVAAPTEAAPAEAGETPVAPNDSGLPAFVTEELGTMTVLRVDTFDQLDANYWEFDPALAAGSNGSAILTGNKSWATALKLKRLLVENQALMLTFQMAKGTHFGIQLSNGAPGTPEYRSFGFYRPQSVMLSRVFQGTEDIRQDVALRGDLKVHRFNTWYQLILAVKNNGHFFLLLWNPADPTQYNLIHDVFDESWMGKEWTYSLEIKDGQLTLNEAQELQ